jgi:hypothetical protein
MKFSQNGSVNERAYTKTVPCTLFALATCAVTAVIVHAGEPQDSNLPRVSVFSTGFYNPRGLKFGPNGLLYVAEGGAGGTQEQCPPPVPIVGPYVGGKTARISVVDRDGVRATLVDGLPSGEATGTPAKDTGGVADIAFIDDTLYALISGAGCTHGNPDVPPSVIRVNPDRSWTVVADLGQFQASHPVLDPNPVDFEPEGTWYSMIVVRGALYAVEPNHGELDRITPDGQITRIADISATQGHSVPTALAYNGTFLVGNLGNFPIVPGSENILKITPSGGVQTTAAGLTTVLGLALDHEKRLYVLETSPVSGFPTPNTGRVVRIEHSGKLTPVVEGLNFPTAMTFGPDGSLYISNQGYGFPPELGPMGQIVRMNLSDDEQGGND